MEMRTKWNLFVSLLVVAAALATAADGTGVPEAPPTEDTIDQISKNETQLVQDFRGNIEIILEEFDADGVVRDAKYWWGEASNQKGRPETSEFVTRAARASAQLKSQINPAGFANLLFPDPAGMDVDHYTWKYLGRELYGEVQTLVFEVKPKPNTGFGRFLGTVWVAAAPDLQICRFDGGFTNPPQKKSAHYLHFVGVRNRVRLEDIGLWIPSTIWIDERDLEKLGAGISQLKARVNVFGLQRNANTNTFAGTLKPEDPEVPVEKPDPSSLHDSRVYYEKTEHKILDWLQGIGVLAPPGPADLPCEKIAYKLRGEAGDFPGQIHCRVLLTSTVEWFVVGGTIVVSKSILDLPPDENALAALLAPAVASVFQSRPVQSISDAILQSRDQALRKLNFQKSAKDRAEYEQRAITLLQKSEFPPKMATAAVFQRAAEKYCGVLGALFAPRFGDRLSLCDPASPLRQLDPLAPRNPRGPAALVLGARLTVNSYTDEVAMVDPPVDDAPFQLVPVDLVPRLLGKVTAEPRAMPFPPAPVVRSGPARAPLKSAGLVVR